MMQPLPRRYIPGSVDIRVGLAIVFIFCKERIAIAPFASATAFSRPSGLCVVRRRVVIIPVKVNEHRILS